MKRLRYLLLILFVYQVITIQVLAINFPNVEKLEIGVKEGDTFNFKISSNNKLFTKLYEVINPKNVSQDNDAELPSSFSIAIERIDQNQVNPFFCWVDIVNDTSACVAYKPRIYVYFASEQYNGSSTLNLRIGSGFITTTDWERTKLYLDTWAENPPLPSNMEVSYTYSDTEDIVSINSRVILSGLNESIYGYQSLDTTTNTKYDRDTGVLQEQEINGMEGFANGSSVELNSYILNSAYNHDNGPSLVTYILGGIGLLGIGSLGYLIFRKYRLRKINNTDLSPDEISNFMSKVQSNTELSENGFKFLFLGKKIDDGYIQNLQDNVPQELVNFKYLMHPTRLLIIKLLHSEHTLTSVEVKNILKISWGDYSSHTISLKNKGYIAIQEKFKEDGSVAQVLSLTEKGMREYDILFSLLEEFVKENSPLSYILTSNSRKPSDDFLYPGEN